MRGPLRLSGEVIVLAALAAALPLVARADLSFETETARMLLPGASEFSMAGEYQHSKEGAEFALPLAYELGLHPRVSLLIEPTPYVAIAHRNQARVHGIGDTEMTATYLFYNETRLAPALAVAGEVKLPTARNRAIGTGMTDYALYLIASKRFGRMDVHANAAYTRVGKPAGVIAQDTGSFALAGDYALAAHVDAFGEVMYTTSALSGGGPGDGPGATAEIGVDEKIGTLGLRYHFSRQLVSFGSVSYDNAHAALLRLGGTWYF